MRAYIFIVAKPATTSQIIERIKSKVKEVVQADSIFGRFDAIITIEAKNLESVNEIVYRVVEKDPNIIHTETAIAFFS